MSMLPSGHDSRSPRIFMMDPMATVPYYTAYLSQALLRRRAKVALGSITYYLDPACFSSRQLENDPGLVDLVGRFALLPVLRRPLKLAESAVNLAALAVRFLASRPDVVHVQFLPMLCTRVPFDLWFLRLCRQLGSKIVLTCHDLLPHNSGDRYREVFGELYGFADAIICHSAAVESRLIGEFDVEPEKISVIPHGPFFYDLPDKDARPVLDRFGVPEGARLVLWQGIVSPYKGVDLLLEAWREVEAARGEAYLVVAGTGAPELLAALREQASAAELKRVRLHQRFITTEELVALYRAADVVVYPYRAITTSGALATGLSFAKTILASDLPVFRELLVDGESASLVPVEAAAIAQGLARLLGDAALRQRYAAKVAEMRFAESAWEEIATQTMAVYERVVAEAVVTSFPSEDVSLALPELSSEGGD